MTFQNDYATGSLAATDGLANQFYRLEEDQPGVQHHGTFCLNQDGSYAYVPDLGFVGQDTFRFIVNDGIWDTPTLTATFHVAGLPVVEDSVDLDDPQALPAIHTKDAEWNHMRACYAAADFQKKAVYGAKDAYGGIFGRDPSSRTYDPQVYAAAAVAVHLAYNNYLVLRNELLKVSGEYMSHIWFTTEEHAVLLGKVNALPVSFGGDLKPGPGQIRDFKNAADTFYQGAVSMSRHNDIIVNTAVMTRNVCYASMLALGPLALVSGVSAGAAAAAANGPRAAAMYALETSCLISGITLVNSSVHNIAVDLGYSPERIAICDDVLNVGTLIALSKLSSGNPETGIEPPAPTEGPLTPGETYNPDGAFRETASKLIELRQEALPPTDGSTAPTTPSADITPPPEQEPLVNPPGDEMADIQQGGGSEAIPGEGNTRAFSATEQAIADYLEEITGITATPNPLEGVPGAVRQGDAIWNGLGVEFKTLDTGASSSTIRRVVNDSVRGGGQARNIVIDARGTGLSRAEAERGVARALGISRGMIDGVTVIGDDYLVGNGPARQQGH